MVDKDRVETGIPGLDSLIEGGLIRGSANLLAGTSGSCKTIFGCQFLWNGIKKGENGLYVTLEESPDDILKNMLRFDIDFGNSIKTKKFNIVNINPGDITDISTFIFNQVKSINAKRLVLDSLTIAAMSWKERPEEFFKFRIKIFDLIKTLKKSGVTSLLISEVSKGSDEISRFGFEEFVADGVIYLYYTKKENARFRGVEVLKQRGSKHSNRIVPITITKNGIEVHPDSDFFEEIK